MKKIAISCVVDHAPKYVRQARDWLASLHALDSSDRADLFVHHTPGVCQSDLAAFAKLGATLVQIEPFGSGVAAYCNKIRQLDTEALLNYDYTILCDADLFFLSCPTRLASGDTIKAKLVDLANPPEPIWRQLLTDAGLHSRIETLPLPLEPEKRTFTTNCNGGLYVLPRAAVADLKTLWPKWARYCLEKTTLLDRWHTHSDQLGFGMALLDAGWPIEHLSIGENFPTHLSAEHYAQLSITLIHALHYHSNVGTDGQIMPVNIGWIDSQIATANATLNACRNSIFDNTFVGSPHLSPVNTSIGSDKSLRHLKLPALLPLLRAISPDEVLDVGCGVFKIMPTMPLAKYVAIDSPDTALEIASKAHSDWRVESIPLSDIASDAFDWGICLDALSRQSSVESLKDFVGDLARVSRKGIIVSSYRKLAGEPKTEFTREMLAEALRSQDSIKDVIVVGTYGDVTIFCAMKDPALPVSSQDASLADIAFGCGEIVEWPLLLELAKLSRTILGFFPKTIIRTIEYPWFAHRLDTGSPGRVLDLGAGVSVLAFWLAQRGNQVVTIDNHPLRRDPAEKEDWNEWGYLDYGLLDRRITSFNFDAVEFTPDAPFDIIYSVSVVEHMPAKIRRAILNKIPSWLAPGGRLFLSLDLVPGTTELWPLSGGQKVDADGEHGTLDDLAAEITAAGLRILETSLRRSIAGSRTDLAFIEAIRPIDPQGI